MLNWKKRISEWRAVMARKDIRISWIVLGRALLTGPVPADVWRDRIRTCLRCELYDRELKACFKTLSDGRSVGCGCYIPFKAFTANPYGDGCWGHSIAVYIGWPKYLFASRWARLKAVWRFIAPTIAAWRPRLPHIHVWHEIFPAKKPTREDWHCWLRHCRCGRVEYKAFEIFGDKQWHSVHDRKSFLWESEREGILESARHHGLLPLLHKK